MGKNIKVKQRIYDTLKSQFENDTVDVTDGRQRKDMIELVMVSRKFDNMTHDEREKFILKQLNPRDANKLSIIVLMSPEELM
jgi:stress-induced morphogen